MAMTPERREVLERLAQVAEGMAYVCSGAHQTRCIGLKGIGFAIEVPSPQEGKRAFRISDAGREWLEAHP